ncbi:hypothetical protein HMPREF1980_01888 [Actinomyces sp. oral taxon 172 str. F0311]|nr:hypothetical protein HMPREF1980_01888 [Actinomyces sp. oral taxon 172 str. F0311]
MDEAGAQVGWFSRGMSGAVVGVAPCQWVDACGRVCKENARGACVN